MRVRDSVLGIKERVPVNEANREFFMASNAARLTRKDGSLVDYDKAAAEEPAAHSILAKLTDVRRPKTSNKIPAAIELSIEESDAIIGINDESGSIDRTVDSIDLEHQPNHESSEKRDKIKSRKNPIESTDEHPEINQNDGKVRRVEKNIRPTMRNHLAPPCSFFAKGLCTRADACPYRHVLIAPRVSSLKSYQNRYHGTADDPDAARIMQFAPNAANFAEKKAPADRTIKTLVIQGLSPNINIPEIVDHFARVQELTNSGTSHVESPSVKTNADRTAAFVSFSNRKTAEAVAQIAIGIVEIGGSSVYVSWSKKSEVDRPVK